ncbi:MAG TPA: zf-HC2 domain-containing protein [Vicinamibacterales bacterium]|nr:zf-HC2 domain-containing protein [Vicinamibacterales bacterium]
MTQIPLERDDRAGACLDAELLASYVDGLTTPAERAVVEAHLAQCEDCHFAFSETVHAGRQAAAAKEKRRWILVGAAAVATAAALVVALVLPMGSRSSAPTTLTIALNGLDAAAGPYRRVEPRVTLLPTHRDLQPVLRSPVSSEKTPPALREAAALVEKTAGRRTTVEERHALGAMYLAEGQAAQAAEILSPLAPSAADAGLLTDIAAAWLARGDAGDAKGALDLLTRAVALDPARAEAWFNLALAAEALGDISRARDAWTRYLSLDPSSQWAAEARRHLERVKR